MANQSRHGSAAGSFNQWASARRFPGIIVKFEAWEKIKTPKGEFEAFRIIMTMAVPTGPKSKGTSNRITTYYYAPGVKAIVSFNEEGSETNVLSTLVEFNAGK